MSLNPERTNTILIAAGEVFSQEGYVRASMDRIASQAGVSKATLYNHFDSKALLFRAVVRQASETFVLELSSLELEPLGLEQALLQIGDYFLRFLLQEDKLAVMRAVLAESQHDPDLGLAFHEAGPAVAQQAIGIFFAGRMAQGEILIDDCDRAARHFMALLRGDLQWRALLRMPVTEAELESHLRSAVVCFLRGCG